MQRVLEQVQVAIHSAVPIHLTGPRGSGKEHLARAIHQEGATQQGSFVPFDCRQSPLWMLQTLQRLLHPDADDSGLGTLEARTLFLIDVAHLPRDVQERLLAEYRPEGARVSRRLPLPRLMSSSTERLADAVEDERLLPELFYLLTTLTIDVPSLRSRRDDLMPLAQAFLESHNRGASRQVTGFADDVWPQLREYQWPGNLDELALVVQEAREQSTGPIIEVKNLPLRFRAGLGAQSVGPASRAADDPLPQLEPHLAQIERELIERALTQANQTKTLAAKLLGLQRPVLYRRMQALKMVERGEPEQTGA
jgi:DNA-binding NtrC family response regulator